MTSKYTRQLISNKIYTEEYDCVQFSLELQHLSQKEGCKLGLAIIGYEDCGHICSFSRAYMEREKVSWLFSQVKS